VWSAGYDAGVPDDELGDALLRAAAEAVRPVVRRLLGRNVPYGRLDVLLRDLFVEVAERDFALADRPQTDSRIALLTGINRKEVRRIRSRDAARPAPSTFGRNRAASLVSRWLADPRATDRAGRPRPIPYRAARGPSFVALAREAAADLPPRAILDELVRSGAVRIERGDPGAGDAVVALQAPSYVPARGRAEKLQMLAQDPPELIETMLQNVLDEGDTRLQRRVFYDNLGADGMAALREAVRREAESFLRRIDRLLAGRDRDRNPRAPAGDRRAAGLGVYYFESAPVPPESGPAAERRGPPGSRRRKSKEREK